MDSTFIVVGAPSYIKAQGAPKAPGDLGAHTCIPFWVSSTEATWTLEGPRGVIKVPVRGRFAVLAAALDGIDTLFAVTTPFAGGVETEICQGKALVDAAVKAAVSHVVYSSVGDADKSTGIPHFDNKFGIEKALRASGLAWTITAPAYFYAIIPFTYVLDRL